MLEMVDVWDVYTATMNKNMELPLGFQDVFLVQI